MLGYWREDIAKTEFGMWNADLKWYPVFFIILQAKQRLTQETYFILFSIIKNADLASTNN